MQAIATDPALELQLIVTGMHLSPEFGLTRRVIDEDGFKIDRKVEMLLSSDTPTGISKSMGLGLIDLADARSEEHTSELQSLMRISYAVFCLKKKNINRL